MKYTYKDFITGQIRSTCGKFKGFTKPTGLLNCRYAIFQRTATSLFVPEYCLTRETKDIINKSKAELAPDSQKVCMKIINS